MCRSTLGCHTRETGCVKRPVRRGRSILIANALEYWAAGQAGRHLASRHGPIRQALKRSKAVPNWIMG